MLRKSDLGFKVLDFHTHICNEEFWFKGKGVLRAYAEEYFRSPVKLAVSLPLLACSEEWMKPREIRPSKDERVIPFELVEGKIEGTYLGLKLHPPLQNISACDQRIYGYYEVAEKTGRPVIFHFGYCSAGNLKFADPLALIEVIDRFPMLIVVMAHMGTGRGDYWKNAKIVALRSDNVYFETSWAPSRVVEEAVKVFGAEKVLFGSDYPFRSVEEEVEKVLSLGFKDDDNSRIFWENAEELLRRVRGRSSYPTVRVK